MLMQKLQQTVHIYIYKTINEDDYIKQIFYVGETALYWKKIPSRTFTAREEVNGFIVSKDKLMLLLGG